MTTVYAQLCASVHLCTCTEAERSHPIPAPPRSTYSLETGPPFVCGAKVAPSKPQQASCLCPIKCWDDRHGHKPMVGKSHAKLLHRYRSSCMHIKYSYSMSHLSSPSGLRSIYIISFVFPSTTIPSPCLTCVREFYSYFHLCWFLFVLYSH